MGFKKFPPNLRGGFFLSYIWSGVASLFLVFLPLSTFARDFKVMPFTEWGGVSEGSRTPKMYGKVGTQVISSFYGATTIIADMALSKYDQAYFGLPLAIVRGGATTTSAVLYFTEEKKYDYSGLVSYPVSWEGYRWEIGGGYKGIYLSNAFSSFHISGPLISLSAGSLYHGGSIYLKGDVAPLLVKNVKNHQKDLVSVAGSKTNSLLGDPTVATNYSLHWRVPWQKSYELTIGYEGETLFFQHTQRYYNGFVVTLIF